MKWISSFLYIITLISSHLYHHTYYHGIDRPENTTKEKEYSDSNFHFLSHHRFYQLFHCANVAVLVLLRQTRFVSAILKIILNNLWRCASCAIFALILANQVAFALVYLGSGGELYTTRTDCFACSFWYLYPFVTFRPFSAFFQLYLLLLHFWHFDFKKMCSLCEEKWEEWRYSTVHVTLLIYASKDKLLSY